jgi:hypothetical protein
MNQETVSLNVRIGDEVVIYKQDDTKQIISIQHNHFAMFRIYEDTKKIEHNGLLVYDAKG